MSNSSTGKLDIVMDFETQRYVRIQVIYIFNPPVDCHF